MDYDDLLNRAYDALPKDRDSSERFEVPRVKAFIQGSKTIVQNFDVLCQQLRREDKFLMKFFTKELAVPGTLDGKRLVLQGKFPERVLNERLDIFVKMYVICKECGKPDTKIVEQGRGLRMLVCEACGARAPVKL